MDDSINSIINQTIGFNNIQIILVNDESIDNTEDICLKYKKLYKKNLIYIKIKHGGVSKARNEGFKYAKGKYINFLDSDDKWDSEAFQNIVLFYNTFKNVDIIAGRIKNFELNNNFQYIDYKFKKTRLVNLTENFNYFQFHAASCVFKKESIIESKFDERVIFAEDVKFVNTILLKKPLLGVVREAIYYSRKRLDTSSASQNIEGNNEFYFTSIYLVLHYLISESRKLYNCIVPFIQFYIAYEIIFRISMKSNKYLNIDNFNKYCKLIENLLEQINEKYLLDIKNYHPLIIIFALSKKYNKDIRHYFSLRNSSIFYSNYELINLTSNRNILSLNFLEIKEDILHLECEDKFWMPKEKYFYFSQIENKIYFPNYFNNSIYELSTIYGTINKGRIIKFDIPIKFQNDMNEGKQIHFYINYMNKNIEIFPSIGQFTHIPPISNSYYKKGSYIIRYANNILKIYRYDYYLAKLFEKQYLLELQKLKKNEIIKIRQEYNKSNKAININNKQEIWLINDRKLQAGDNGEYFFRYLCELKPKDIDFYFVIDKNCSDYDRLKRFSRLLDFNSSRHLNLLLNANKIITSTTYFWFVNLFGNDAYLLRDLLNYDLIFLNNGIIKDDLSIYINKIQKNFQLLITSSKREYQSIINYNYGYNKYNLILTGMPRFDYLHKLEKIIKKEKIIIIFPTWRNYIQGTFDIKNFESIKYEKFIFTKYFNFYNDLINNPLLLEQMNYNNYIGILCLHPNFAEQYLYFNRNKLFNVKSNCFEHKLFLKASLLITDYSSIFFDFAYIKTPIIYSQFDFDEYREKQFKEGYFNYNNEGFGPICYDLNCTIKSIIKQINNNCNLQNLYSKRINKFFKYIDDQNCFRIYKQIKNYNNIKYESFKNTLISIIFILLFITRISKLLFAKYYYYLNYL